MAFQVGAVRTIRMASIQYHKFYHMFAMTLCCVELYDYVICDQCNSGILTNIPIFGIVRSQDARI